MQRVRDLLVSKVASSGLPGISPTSRQDGSGAGSLSPAVGINRAVASRVMHSVAKQIKNTAGQVRVLLMRIQTSTLAKDRRDAVEALLAMSATDVAECLSEEDVNMAFSTAEMNNGDVQLMTLVLELFAVLTESDEALESLPSPADRERIGRCILDHHFECILAAAGGETSGEFSPKTESKPPIGDVPSRPSGSENSLFWLRLHAIKIFEHLYSLDEVCVQKKLLAVNGLSCVVDVLKDRSNEGALRNEGLVLLKILTLFDQELQTILAFDNCFDVLIDISEEEGGVDGGLIVTDCLTIIKNMLRGNKTTQKLFKELGCSRRLAALLVDRATLPGIEGNPLSEQAAEAVLAIIEIFSALLSFSDKDGDEKAIRDHFTASNVLAPLARVGFSGLADDRTSVAALRTLAASLEDHAGCAQALLGMFLPVPSSSATNEEIPCLWVVMHTVLCGTDAARRVEALRILNTGLQIQEAAVAFADVLMSRMGTLRQAKTMGENKDYSCGSLLTRALFFVESSRAAEGFSIEAPYYAAWILSRLLLVPRSCEQLLNLPFSVSKSSRASPHSSGSGSPSTFFTCYVHRVREMLSTRTCTLQVAGAMVRPLLMFFQLHPASCKVFLTEATTPFNFFLEWATRVREPAHIRLLSLSICVSAALNSVSPQREEILAQLTQKGAAGLLQDLFYNVSSSADWTEAPASLLAMPQPALYDVPYTNQLQYLCEEGTRLLQSIRTTNFNKSCTGKPYSSALERGGGVSDKSVAVELDGRGGASRNEIDAEIERLRGELETTKGALRAKEEEVEDLLIIIAELDEALQVERSQQHSTAAAPFNEIAQTPQKQVRSDEEECADLPPPETAYPDMSIQQEQEKKIAFPPPLERSTERHALNFDEGEYPSGATVSSSMQKPDDRFFWSIPGEAVSHTRKLWSTAQNLLTPLGTAVSGFQAHAGSVLPRNPGVRPQQQEMTTENDEIHSVLDVSKPAACTLSIDCFAEPVHSESVGVEEMPESTNAINPKFVMFPPEFAPTSTELPPLPAPLEHKATVKASFAPNPFFTESQTHQSILQNQESFHPAIKPVSSENVYTEAQIHNDEKTPVDVPVDSNHTTEVQGQAPLVQEEKCPQKVEIEASIKVEDVRKAIEEPLEASSFAQPAPSKEPPRAAPPRAKQTEVAACNPFSVVKDHKSCASDDEFDFR